MKKRKFKKRYIAYGALILLVISTSIFWSNVKKILPPPSVVAFAEMFNGEKELPGFIRNWGEKNTESRDYESLPEIMTFNDGTSVNDVEDYEKRKDEIIELFKTHVYGELPDDQYQVSFRILEESDMALDGKAIRQQVEMSIETEFGSSMALILLYLPKDGEVISTFVGLNFKGNHAVYNDPDILPSFATDKEIENIHEERGVQERRWPLKEIIARGYGVATVFCDDFAPDNKDTYNSRWINIFNDPDESEEEVKAVTMWSFGLMRAIDYLETLPNINMDGIISIGHSRLGKASLWAGANDERIDLVISNDSGNSGAAISRSNRGERVASIQVFFPYWFTENYMQYSNNENELPVDQHMLLASIAPRKLYVASADQDYWADPEGEYLSTVIASEGFEIYGYESFSPVAMPSAGERVFTESVAYHIRPGLHDIIIYDWSNFMDYADEYLLIKK
ncbi:MAG: hypothetical protein JEZ08_23560 [Clostridiales bacterium]|nr:hypothetical protein [Clostridiales bacterium]